MNEKLKFGRFKQRKKTNYKKSLILILILLFILYLYSNSETFLERVMGG